MTTTATNISYKQHISSLVTLGIPIIIGQLGTIIQGLSDTIMVGHYSSNSLAAAGFVNNIMVLVLVFAMGYSYAITPVVGPLHANKQYTEAGMALKAGIKVNALLSIVLFCIMGALYFVLDKMGQPEELLPEIRKYYIVVLVSVPFQAVFNAYKQFSDGIGNTRLPMWIMISANLFNIIGNWLLIYGIGPFPEMGLLGAGISTLLSRILMLATIMYIVRYSDFFKVYHEGLYRKKTDNSLCRKLHSLGWPLGLQICLETASFALCAVMQGWLGTAPLAAHQVMTNISTVTFMVYYGIGASVAIRVSHFNGMNDFVNVRKTAYAGYIMILVATFILSSAIYVFRNDICSIFTNDESINSIILSLILPFILYQFGDGLQINFSNALRGIADVKPLMRYAFLCYVVISLPLSYYLGIEAGWGSAGIWMAFPVALTTAGMLFYRRFYRKTKV